MQEEETDEVEARDILNDTTLVDGQALELGDGDDVGGDLPAEGLVVIETTDDEKRVGQIRELLEESGIPCFLSDELSPAQTPEDETKVLVPREMLSDAKRLVRDFVAMSKPVT